MGSMTVIPSAVFPLRVSTNARTLLAQTGRPFPLLGRNAWSVIGLSAVDAATFLADTVAKGFNAIEVWIPGAFHDTANVPRDGASNLPFLKRLDGTSWDGSFTGSLADFTTPNPAYWAFVDTFVATCRSAGILLLWFPAYVGYPAAEKEGWMAEMEANGATKMQTYGAYLASRYQGYANIAWGLGGDRGTDDQLFSAGQKLVEQGLIDGLTSVAGKFYFAEWRHPNIASAQSDFGSYITLNSTYVGATDVVNQGQAAYAVSPTMPAFMMESPFETQADPVRRFCWWGWLSTINGYCLGNVPLFTFATGWADSLDTRGALDCAKLNAFVRSIPYQTLTPETVASAHTKITAGGGTSVTSANWVGAAYNGTTLFVAYLPPAHTGTVTVDMTVMSGTTTSRWFDPTTGTYTADASGIANTGTHVFTRPGNNSLGDADWVLRLDA
jgi:hypothetical protein